MTAPVICAVNADEPAPRHAQWAADLAAALQAPLLLCHVMEPLPAPALYAPGAVGMVPPAPSGPPSHDLAEERRRQQAMNALELLSAELGADLMQLRVVPGGGSVSAALRDLVDACRAQLLVVGSRGHGAVRAALLGSTSHDLAAHAPCPVVVVPPEARFDREDSS